MLIIQSKEHSKEKSDGCRRVLRKRVGVRVAYTLLLWWAVHCAAPRRRERNAAFRRARRGGGHVSERVLLWNDRVPGVKHDAREHCGERLVALLLVDHRHAGCVRREQCRGRWRWRGGRTAQRSAQRWNRIGLELLMGSSCSVERWRKLTRSDCRVLLLNRRRRRVARRALRCEPREVWKRQPRAGERQKVELEAEREEALQLAHRHARGTQQVERRVWHKTRTRAGAERSGSVSLDAPCASVEVELLETDIFETQLQVVLGRKIECCIQARKHLKLKESF